MLLCWMILCMDSCLSQRDCTGVDCPDLQNCIETRLEKGACCPTCTQRGCTCEGYQYYDCIQAGFREGKVPQGESYFVDFGSTECSCPQGGGKISCHFIPCPEISPNCIDILQPADGCPECGRIGCMHGNKKYEAGHSFQMDHCHVCHCPNDGGRLMCSPIPGCDLRSSNKPTWVTTTDNNNPSRAVSSRHESRQMSPAEPFSKLALGSTLPLYKQDPPNFGTEDYDYTLARPTSSSVQDLVQPLESTTEPPAFAESSSSSFSFHDGRRHELRETQDRPDSERSREAEITQSTTSTTGTQSKTSTSQTTTLRVTTENHRPQQEAGERIIRHDSDRGRVTQDTLKDTAYTARANKGTRHRHGQGRRNGNHGGSLSAGHKEQEQEKVSVERRQSVHKEEQGPLPTIQFSPTNRSPVRMSEDREQPQRQPQTLHNYQAQGVEGDTKGKLAYFQGYIGNIFIQMNN